MYKQSEFTEESRKMYTQTGVPLLVVFFDIDRSVNVKRTSYYERRLQLLSKDYKNQFRFVIAELNRMGEPATWAATDQDKEVLVYPLPSATCFLPSLPSSSNGSCLCLFVTLISR